MIDIPSLLIGSGLATMAAALVYTASRVQDSQRIESEKQKLREYAEECAWEAKVTCSDCRGRGVTFIDSNRCNGCQGRGWNYWPAGV